MTIKYLSIQKEIKQANILNKYNNPQKQIPMKKLLFCLLTVLASLNIWNISAQSTLTIADGTTTNGYVPLYGFYADAYLKAEFVVPAADLAPMLNSTITGMKFYSSTSSASWGSANFQVFLTTVNSTSISSFTGTSGATIVYEGVLTINANEMDIVFDNPFSYNGGNLLVGIYNTVKGSYVSSNWYGVTTTGASCQGYSYSSLGDVSATQRDFIPKTTFSYMTGTISCYAPTDLTVGNITTTDAEVSWTASTSAGNYIIQYKTANQSWENANGSVSSTNQYNITGLNPGSRYELRVATDCGGDTSMWKYTAFTTNIVPVELPYSNSFTDNDIWLLNNGSCNNYWIIDTLNGENALFITNDGVTPGYSISSEAGVAAEKHFVVGDASTLLVSFDLLCGGESSWDFLKVFFAPISAEYPASTSPDWGTYSYSTYAMDFSAYGNPSYPYIINLTDSNTIHIDLIVNNPVDNPDASSVAKLVFGWKNDGSYGNGEGPVITNLQISIPSCNRPSMPSVSNIGAFAADVSWEAPSSDANNFFVQYAVAGTDWNDASVITENVSGTTLALTGLESATNYQLRVATNCNGDTSLWRVTNFTTIPSCSSPVDVSVSQITGTAALISWNPAEYGATSYTLAYAENGQTNWNSQVVNENSYMLSGLQPVTTYEVMVSSNCEAGTADTIYLTFSTNCLVGGNITIGNGTETNSYIPSYSLYNYSISEQLFTSNEMGSATTLRSVAFNISNLQNNARKLEIYLLHTNATSITGGLDASNAQLVYSNTTETSLTEGWNTLTFTTPFDYDGMHNLLLVVLDKTGTWSGTNSWSAHTGFTDCSYYAYQDSDPYSINSIPTGGTNSNKRSDVIFGGDCDSTTTCVAPNVFIDGITESTISVNWVAGYTETAWDLEYSTDDTNWTSASVTTAPYQLTGLTPSTHYSIRIRSNCGPNDFSSWVYLSAQTDCSTITNYPFEENFSNNSASLSCWTIIDANADGKTFMHDSESENMYYPYDLHNAANDWLISPEFVMDGGQMLDFDYWAFSSYYAEQFQVFAIGTDSTIALTPVIVVNNSTAENMMLDLSDLNGNYKIGFHCVSAANMYNFLIDNFRIRNAGIAELTVDPTSMSFSAEIGLVPMVQTASISGVSLTSDIAVSTAAPFEVSIDGTTYATTATIPVSGLTTNATLYVRYVPTTAGNDNGSVTLTSGTESVTIALTGVATDCSVAQALPYTENFDSYVGTTYDDNNGIKPSCWATFSSNTTYGAPHIIGSGIYNFTNSAPNSLIFTCNDSGTEAYAALPTFASPLNTLKLTFWRAMESSSYGVLTVGYVTNMNDLAGSYVVVDTIPSVYYNDATAADTISVNFSTAGNIPANGNICFCWYKDGVFYSCCIDDIEVTIAGEAPVVVEPTVVTNNVSNLAQTSATLNGAITDEGNQTITARGFEWKLTNGGSYTTVAATGTTMSYNLTELTAETSYTYRAFATTANTTTYGDEVTFITLGNEPQPCNAPTNLAVNEITANTATVSWTAVGNETSWNVQYKMLSASQWQEATVNTTSYVMEGLTPNSNYEVRVKAICTDGNESNFVSTDFNTRPDAIDNITLSNSISLMPNPADNYIELRINSSVNVSEAVVYNAFGQMVQTVTQTDNKARIDLSAMASGMYFVKVSSDKMTATKKFIRK